MKKQHVAIEISHSFIKILIGSVNNGQVVVHYVKKVPANHLLENGIVKDKMTLSALLSKLNPIVDEDYHINQLLDDVVILLPPYGLEIFHTSQNVPVISAEKTIGNLDIMNIYSIVRNMKLPVDNDFVNIIIDSYKLDNGNRYVGAPIGKQSSSISFEVNVYTLPKKIAYDYSSAVIASGIKISSPVVSSFAASEFLKTDPNIGENFFLIDIGSSSTSVSFLANKTLLATRSFSWGGENITTRMMEFFNINEKEAEKIKILYGYDERKMEFSFPIITKDFEEGKKEYFREDVNNLIANELDKFITLLAATIEQLSAIYKIPSEMNIPFVISGGGSKLNGLINYLKGKLNKEDISQYTPKVIGARDPSLLSLLGSIMVKEKYLDNLDNTHTSANLVTRDE